MPTDPAPGPAPRLLAVPVTARDHARGPADASLTLVEYADVQCPHCAQATTVLWALQAELSDILRVVYRHFPLTDSHPHAQKAAEALEAAGAQGRFWELHDRLYRKPDDLEVPALVKAARRTGLDVKRFERELLEGTHSARVRADFLGGLRAGVEGTPALFLDGERHEGSWEYEPLAAELVRRDRALRG